MIDIETLRKHYNDGSVYVTEHANIRFHQRGITARDIRNAVMNGEIIEQYPDDYPFPSCLILGNAMSGKPIHTVLSNEGTASRVITAYYPDRDYWSDDNRTRRETEK